MRKALRFAILLHACGCGPQLGADVTADATTNGSADTSATTSVSATNPTGDPTRDPTGQTTVGTSATTVSSDVDTGVDPDDTGFEDVTTMEVGCLADQGGGPLECDQWIEDCACGEKCSPFASDGGKPVLT